SFVSGTGPQEDRRKRLLPVGLFVLGFSVVFTTLGAFSGAVLPVLRSPLGTRVAGIVVAVFGLAMLLYAFRIRWPGLYAERRPFLSRLGGGRVGAFPLGMAFATGWTPCIGPVLGGILGLAGAQGGSTRGALLLFSYSAGLGVPFLLVALGVGRVLDRVKAIRRNYHWVAGISGTLMLGVGILLVSGLWVRLMAPILRLVNRFEPPI
ncbi:MAG: cytochrome C biogenesis protein, partial [Actinobacteria bacterium]|nr:cytochrome C biogenesis protein [Actinomycetota bacterium]